MKHVPQRRALGLTTLIPVLALAACGGQSDAQGLAGTVKVDGSSTVQPLSSAAAELYAQEQPAVRVTVGAAGTSGGFELFCAGKTDLSDASRPIEPEEKRACQQSGVRPTQLPVAVDALTVAVNPSVTWTDCLTVDQLRKIWAPTAEDKVTSWSDVDPAFPDQPLELFGPGTDSGTFDYFTEEVVDEEGASRSDYEASEDDNVLVQGVAKTKGALGYFGYTYYAENREQLKALAIDDGNGCVPPTPQTARSGEYSPLSRPLFVYVSGGAYAKQPEVAGYVDYYVANLHRIVGAAGFIQLSAQQLHETKANLRSLQKS